MRRRVDLMTADLFMPFTHLKPHLFDMLMSIFLPSDYRTCVCVL